jgi:hypothetical protein
MRQNLKPDEVRAWLPDPVTVRLRELLHERIEQRKEQWASGAFHGSQLDNAAAVGEIGGLQWVLDLTPEEFAGVGEDGGLADEE